MSIKPKIINEILREFGQMNYYVYNHNYIYDLVEFAYKKGYESAINNYIIGENDKVNKH